MNIDEIRARAEKLKKFIIDYPDKTEATVVLLDEVNEDRLLLLSKIDHLQAELQKAKENLQAINEMTLSGTATGSRSIFFLRIATRVS